MRSTSEFEILCIPTVASRFSPPPNYSPSCALLSGLAEIFKATGKSLCSFCDRIRGKFYRTRKDVFFRTVSSADAPGDVVSAVRGLYDETRSFLGKPILSLRK